VERFCRKVGIFSKERQVQVVLDARCDRAGLADTDTVPRSVWRLVREAKRSLSWAEVSARAGRPRNHNWHVDKQDLGRERLALLAKALDSEALRGVVDADVRWDEVVGGE